MDVEEDLIQDAMELFTKALESGARPARDERYRQLMAKYTTSTVFRQVFQQLCHGAKVVILSADNFGVVISPLNGSIFAMKVADYRRGLKEEHAMVIGIIHIAIAHSFYPDVSDLECNLNMIRATTVDDVVEILIKAAKNLQEQKQKHKRELTTQEERVFQCLLSIPETYQTPHSEQGGRNSIKRLTKSVMRQLGEQHRLKWVSDQGNGTYETLHEYRVQLREFALSQSYQIISELLDTETGAKEV